MRRLIYLCILVLSVGPSYAQSKGWEAGGWLGAAHYFGDLNTTLTIDDPGVAAGLRARYCFNRRLSLSFSANYGRISASDADSENPSELQRNLSFRSNVFDLTPKLEFNFLPFEHGSYNNYFTPYVGLGFSVFRFNPQAELDGEWIDLAPLGTEGQRGSDLYSRVNGALTAALGFKYSLSYYWTLNIEISTHRAFTDYIDDVSTVYPNSSGLDPLAQALSDRSLPNADGVDLVLDGKQRGNATDNDNYNFFSFSLVYWFGQIRCPDISRPGRIY